MERQIKFRGRCRESKKWVYGYYLYMFDVNYDSRGNDDVPERLHYIVDDYVEPNEVIPESAGQYTGLKDKNGVEIYEGDIFHCNGVNYVLRFLKLGGAYTVHKIREESNERFLLHCNHQLEVIGNIHENPELLKD